MAYLDISPMTTALLARPDEFEFSNDCLHHIPSRHTFQFDAQGRVQVLANCYCSSLPISNEQAPQLYASFQQWHANYWRPLEINKEFASHFQPPSRVRKLLIDLAARMHIWLILGGHRRVHVQRTIGAPAKWHVGGASHSESAIRTPSASSR